MSNPGTFKPGQTGNPGGRSREQRSAARQQASFIQRTLGNGQKTAEFYIALLFAGGQPDPEDPDGDVVVKLAEKTLRRYGLVATDVTVQDKKDAAKYLDDRGLGKPELSIDLTSDGNAVGTVSLIPVDLGALTDEQLAEVKRRVRAAREASSPPDGDEPG
jgi:hypothetical protein